MSSSARARVGVVGFGRWGRNLARNFHAIGCLAGLCDSDPDHLRAAADTYPAARAFPQSEALIRSGDVDAVAIATPAGTHHELAASALTADLHVFVEKPMTTDLAAARTLVVQARAAGLQLVTGHLLHYHPAFETLRAMVHDGRLGALRGIVTSRLTSGPETPREHVIWEFAPHDIAMILACTDELPLSVCCFRPDSESNGPSAAHTRVELAFSSGLRSQTTVSWRGLAKVQRFEVEGNVATAVFDDVAPAGSKLTLAPTGQPPSPVPVPDREPLASECAAFVEAVATGVAPPSGADEGLRVMTVLDACFRSLEERRTVPLQIPENGG
ncbi:MAG: Gfo/Idh/MocA family oxidoreductase [Alphaproteobacteria bacterium]|nr:Gfo/Idh/MocA family oxidoreductase [Alphaproteobacteria bacterium]